MQADLESTLPDEEEIDTASPAPDDSLAGPFSELMTLCETVKAL